MDSLLQQRLLAEQDQHAQLLGLALIALIIIIGLALEIARHHR